MSENTSLSFQICKSASLDERGLFPLKACGYFEAGTKHRDTSSGLRLAFFSSPVMLVLHKIDRGLMKLYHTMVLLPILFASMRGNGLISTPHLQQRTNAESGRPPDWLHPFHCVLTACVPDRVQLQVISKHESTRSISIGLRVEAHRHSMAPRFPAVSSCFTMARSTRASMMMMFSAETEASL